MERQLNAVSKTKKKATLIRQLHRYPYMVGVISVGILSVIAQILIVLDVVNPLIAYDVDAVSSVMSTCSEVIAGMYGITLTGYIFFADRFQDTTREDESLYDVVQALLIRYNHMAGIISLMSMVCIVLGEGIVLYGSNTLLSEGLYRFWVDETLLLFFWTFDFILYFVISVLDPQKVNRISRQKKDKLSDSAELGDLQGFLADYKVIETCLHTLMEKLISSSPFIPGNISKSKPKSVYTLETLRNYSRISFQLWRKLEKLRQYYNLTLHDPNLSVTREMCDLAKEVRADLEEKIKNV